MEREQHAHTPDEAAAAELAYRLANLGPETDRAVLITIRLADTRHVRDIWLSANDVQTLIDGAAAISELHECAALADPEPLPQVDAEDVNDVLAGFDQLLGNGGE